MRETRIVERSRKQAFRLQSPFLLAIAVCVAVNCAEISALYAQHSSSHKKIASKIASKNSSQKTPPPKTQKQLEKLKKSIAEDKKKLQAIKKKEQQVAVKLKQYKKTDKKISTEIKQLEHNIRRTGDSLQKTALTLGNVDSKRATLKREYTALAQVLYKKGIKAQSLNNSVDNAFADMPHDDAYISLTTHYGAERLTQAVLKRLQILGMVRDSLHGKKQTLATELSETNEQKSAKEEKKKELRSDIVSKQKELKAVVANKKQLQQQIEEKNASARKLESLISGMVSKAEGRMKTRSGGNTSAKERAEYHEIYTESRFHKKSLPWPVDSRTVLHKFGQYTNPQTNTVIENLGIGIRTSSGSRVCAVAKGTVSLVSWLPGYGSLMIIDHANSFRTVYANLASVSVSEGQSVKSGTVLGTSGRTVDGEYLHFELWRDREKLNPTLWLK